MKYWELSTVCYDQPDLFDRFGDRPEWSQYAQWHHDHSALVEAQDREKLDAVLPDEFCEYVLAGMRDRYYLENGQLRGGPTGRRGEVAMTAVEAYRRYGGGALQEVREYGSYPVARSEQ